ncbi:MAG: hypothetical protein IT242_08675 [Bacteroidia bacterium]|nr:hypothetical protein [Bacteroidia bacterium]
MFRSRNCVFFAGITLLALSSCEKNNDDNDHHNPVGCSGVLPAQVTFMVNGSHWCSDMGGFADLGTDLTIHGENQNGSTINMELNDLSTGPHVINSSINHFIYTDAAANGFESNDSNPGSLVIDSHNTSNNTIKGHFTVTLKSPVTGNLTLGSGEFTAVYTE